MMRLTEVSIPVHLNGWDILHRNIRASNLRRLAIAIDLGSKGPEGLRCGCEDSASLALE